jgi:hypothetical protein
MAEDWQWCSLRKRMDTPAPDWLDHGPIPLPADWTEIVNLEQTNAELEEFRRRVKVGK